MGDNLNPGSGYPMDKFISQLLLVPQKSMTYVTVLEFHGKVVSWLILKIGRDLRSCRKIKTEVPFLHFSPPDK